MAFKSAKDFNEARYGNFFVLRNDGDYADVIFLYPSWDDVLIADKVHYIRSDEYTGYVHCCGKGCPACAKNIRIQSKLFIPVYNIQSEKIEFFDRNSRFEIQLQNDVFSRFANPSNYVFRITRHGVAGSMDTTYEINLMGEVAGISYDRILSDNGAVFPDYYSVICKEVSVGELSNMLNSNGDANATYTVTPRATTVPAVERYPVSETAVPEEMPSSYSVTPRTVVPQVIAESNDSALELPEIEIEIPDLDDDDVQF